MDNKTYIDLLDERYQRYFDIKRNYELMDKKLDIFASYNAHNERFVLSKKAIIDEFNNYEYCLVMSKDELVDAGEVDNFTDYLINTVKELAKPSSTHMCTYITGVIAAARGFSTEAALKVKKFKYSKDFLFTIRGWCDVRLVMADPEAGTVVTNKKGREVEKFYIVKKN